jgi:hypothetical protein
MSDVTELPPLEELPAPRPAGARPTRGRSRLWLSVTSGLLGAATFAGAALLSDARRDEGEQATATNGAEPVPIVEAATPGEGDDGERAGSLGEYAAPTWSTATRTAVLGGWGAVTSGVVAEGGQTTIAPIGTDGIPVADPRLVDTATPAFADPCAVRDRDPDEGACPDVDHEAQVVLGGDRPPPNAVSAHPFPTGDEAGGRTCDFADAAADQLPLLVLTANPGRVVVAAGGEEVGVDSDDAERDEWDTWMERPLGTRPPESFVAHCILLDRPDVTGAFTVEVSALDDDDQQAATSFTVGNLVEQLPPVTVTPVDGTMVRVDVPLPDGDDLASVTTVPTSLLGGVADCQRVTPELAAAAAGGWRRGAASVLEPADDDARPWLEDAPRLQRVTLALAEGEPNVVCASVGSGPALRRLTLVAVPPDARRLELGATELRLTGAPPGGVVQLEATFPELGWTPCGVRIAAAGAGSTLPGEAGVLCTSGGDTGALGAAGSVAELRIGTGEGAVHTARIALVATAGGRGLETYRLPIPLPTFEGILCTEGADQPSCVEPGTESSLGTVIVVARWTEGPVGERTTWSITGPA